jgi:hypothetical protein
LLISGVGQNTSRRRDFDTKRTTNSNIQNPKADLPTKTARTSKR